MADIQNLEFKNMLPGQGEAVCDLVRQVLDKQVLDKQEEKDFTPLGRVALDRYASPEALEHRGSLGYVHELAYVSEVLVGMIELRGPDRISMLYIHPNYANKGLGSRLVTRAVARCAAIAPKTRYMTVYATDSAANFYERAGFVRSGARKESNGVFSIPYRLDVKVKGKAVPAKLYGSPVELFVFTGTGNSLLIAQTVAETLRQEGKPVHLRSMDTPCPDILHEESAVGLAFPVACFSTYPTVWRFVESMPMGAGREVFMLGTCGGAAVGMQGPLRKSLLKKGYKPVAAGIFVMPGNYNNKTLLLEKNTARIEKATLEARSFAYDLLKGGRRWGEGIPLVSSLGYNLGQTRKPWDFFYKIFPIAADFAKCIRCRRCIDECPAKAILMEDSGPVINPKVCESCQRCVGFCPTGAMHVPGKPAEPYRAMSYEDFKAAFR
ncbi:MAG: EFR1 family ferrodoxin [Synergistaceae bacterium]|jgi:ferredoxin/GNAT superfamily N-acetyltransferase|nr:EFR1 family ferrodoxin [Synergistaceae bacterium]